MLTDIVSRWRDNKDTLNLITSLQKWFIAACCNSLFKFMGSGLRSLRLLSSGAYGSWNMDNYDDIVALEPETLWL